MKTTKIIFTTAAAAILAAVTASAQYRSVGGDGITASPKVRQMLDERQAAAQQRIQQGPMELVIFNSPVAGITASPKALQNMGSQNLIVSSGGAYGQVAPAGYEPNAPDGIAASPKVRQQLSERMPQYIIAPLK